MLTISPQAFSFHPEWKTMMRWQGEGSASRLAAFVATLQKAPNQNPSVFLMADGDEDISRQAIAREATLVNSIVFQVSSTSYVLAILPETKRINETSFKDLSWSNS
jgi:hypothetical protein